MRGMHRTGRGSRRAQSTLEYILVLAAILVAAIIAATNLIRPAVNQSMDDSQKVITKASAKVAGGLGL